MEGEGQMPVGGTEQGITPSNNLQEGQVRVTAENVRHAIEERERLYSSLMNDMEASVSGHGQYFVKYGDRNKGPDSKIDTRALLLINPVVDRKDQKTLFIIVTRDGAKGLGLKAEGSGKVEGEDRWVQEMKENIKHELEYTLPEEQREWELDKDRVNPSEYGFGDYGRVEINNNSMGDPSITKSVVFPDYDTELRDVDFGIVKEAIEESQKVAEEPHYLRLQEEQQKIADADKLSKVIKQLPPK